MKEVYISVDVETTGPIVGFHSMVAIGACVVGTASAQFSAILRPISPHFVPEAMRIVGHELSHYERHGRPAVEVLREFRQWVLNSAPDSSPIFVGFNAAFDWGFVNWYFLTFLDSNPFGIAPLDIKSFYAGLVGVSWEETRSSMIPERFRPSDVHAHEALDDAIEQAAMFERMRKE